MLTHSPWLSVRGLRHGFLDRTECASGVWTAVGDLPLAVPRQVHGTRVALGDADTRPEADALVTAEPGLAVGVVTADCVPVLLVDRRVRAAAAVHAGWRGGRRRTRGGARRARRPIQLASGGRRGRRRTCDRRVLLRGRPRGPGGVPRADRVHGRGGVHRARRTRPRRPADRGAAPPRGGGCSHGRDRRAVHGVRRRLQLVSPRWRGDGAPAQLCWMGVGVAAATSAPSGSSKRAGSSM
jgi:hypothetical protein